MYAKVQDNNVLEYPLTEAEVKKRFNHVSFPEGKPLDVQVIATQGLVPVVAVEKPIESGLVFEESTPIKTEQGFWQQVWVSRNLTEEELAQRRTSLVTYLSSYASEKEDAGMEFMGMNIKSDSETQHKLMAVRIIAKESITEGTPFTPIRWKGQTEWYDLDAPTILMLANVLFQYVEYIFASRYEVEALIHSGDVGTEAAAKTKLDELVTEKFQGLITMIQNQQNG